jgi:hypothetical protein
VPPIARRTIAGWNAWSPSVLLAPKRKKNCGPITDASDRTDYDMAREYLARSVANPLQAAAELVRCRDAAGAAKNARACQPIANSALASSVGGC